MAKKVIVTGKPARRIEVTGKPQRRIKPAEFAAALGAEPVGEPHAAGLDSLSLAGLGTQLLSRLRSSGGRPALADATEICRVPLGVEDIKTLEAMVAQIEGTTDAKPSVGQLVSVIVRTHLDALKGLPTPNATSAEAPISRTALQQMLDEQLSPLREKVNRLERELHAAGK